MIIAALLAAGAAAAASPPPVVAKPPQTLASAATSDANGSKIVCKYVEVTGTRFPSKDCRTQAEWNQLTADSRDVTERQQWAYGLMRGGNGSVTPQFSGNGRQ